MACLHPESCTSLMSAKLPFQVWSHEQGANRTSKQLQGTSCEPGLSSKDTWQQNSEQSFYENLGQKLQSSMTGACRYSCSCVMCVHDPCCPSDTIKTCPQHVCRHLVPRFMPWTQHTLKRFLAQKLPAGSILVPACGPGKPSVRGSCVQLAFSLAVDKCTCRT